MSTGRMYFGEALPRSHDVETKRRDYRKGGITRVNFYFALTGSKRVGTERNNVLLKKLNKKMKFTR